MSVRKVESSLTARIFARANRDISITKLSRSLDFELSPFERSEQILRLDFSRVPLTESQWTYFNGVVEAFDRESFKSDDTKVVGRPYLSRLGRGYSYASATKGFMNTHERIFLQMMIGRSYEEPHELVKFLKKHSYSFRGQASETRIVKSKNEIPEGFFNNNLITLRNLGLVVQNGLSIYDLANIGGHNYQLTPLAVYLRDYAWRGIAAYNQVV